MTTGNPILDKNLDCIEKYNPQLKQKLLSITELKNDIQLTETNLKEPNLLYNGIPLHSFEGADAEIEKAFEKVSNTKNSRHVIFGMGLGYLFKLCCEKSKGIVFLFERNLEILRVTLEIVDFSQELSQKNVFVFSDLNIFTELYAKTCTYKNNAGFFVLNSYRDFLYKNEIKNITEKIKDIIFTENGKIEGSKKLIFGLANSVIQNLPPTSDAIPLEKIGEIYKDKTALIVSAGPTINENIEIIKKNRNKFVIFCIGQALKALTNQGIKPDFLAILEYKDCSGQVKGVDLSDINLIIAPYTHPNTYKLHPKKTFLFTDTSEVNKFWETITNYDITYHEAKGTVSYMAMVSAQILGCKKIILVGMDLALIDNKCYGENTAYSNLVLDEEVQNNEFKLKIVDEKMHLDALNSAIEGVSRVFNTNNIKNDLAYKQKLFTLAKGISGEMISTFANYALFVDYFKEFAAQNQDLQLINTSLRGLQIDGFQNLSLSQAIKDLPEIQIQDAARVHSDFKFNKKNIIKKIEECLSILNTKLSLLEKGEKFINDSEKNLQEQKLIKENFSNIENEIKKLFEITSRIPSMKGTLDAYEVLIKTKHPEFLKVLDLKSLSIETLLPIYTNLNKVEDYLFNAISFKENLEVKFITEGADKLSIPEIIITYSALKTYFINVKKACETTIDLLKESYGELNQQ